MSAQADALMAVFGLTRVPDHNQLVARYRYLTKQAVLAKSRFGQVPESLSVELQKVIEQQAKNAMRGMR